MNEELLEVVDMDGKTIKAAPRSRVHGNPSLIHRVVHVLIFDKKGRLLLQKRSMSKDVAPGKWDTSVGGHVNAGEPVEEAVAREMEEELGIRCSSPRFLYTYTHSNPYETEFVHTYSCVHDGEVKFQKEEIDEVRYWALDEIKIETGKGALSDNFEHEITMYLKYAGKHGE
ncbi:MAG: NUDIX domain-containing protein [Nitrospirae bacterium]|nr:NUDIX domain-containing protein [Nitrospirota bacterium]